MILAVKRAVPLLLVEGVRLGSSARESRASLRSKTAGGANRDRTNVLREDRWSATRMASDGYSLTGSNVRAGCLSYGNSRATSDIEDLIRVHHPQHDHSKETNDQLHPEECIRPM